MNKKQFVSFFIAEYVALLLTAGALFSLEDVQLPLMPEEKNQLAYLLEFFCALSTVGGSFLAIKQRHWLPVLRLSLLIVPALLALFLFFFLGDANMLYCLPLLAIVSFILLKQVLEE